MKSRRAGSQVQSYGSVIRTLSEISSAASHKYSDERESGDKLSVRVIRDGNHRDASLSSDVMCLYS